MKLFCNGCQLMAISGKITHETGCNYNWINPLTGEGYEKQCFDCGSNFVPETKRQKLCEGCLNSETYQPFNSFDESHGG